LSDVGSRPEIVCVLQASVRRIRAVAARKLEGQWLAESVEPAVERLKMLLGSKIEFGSSVRVAFSMADKPPLEGDAEVESDDGSGATFVFPTPRKPDRTSVNFAGDSKMTVTDGQVKITYKRATLLFRQA